MGGEFLQTGREIVPIPGSYALVEKVAEGFGRFLELVQPDQRERWTYEVLPNEDPDHKPDDGYMPRKGDAKVSGGRDDIKQTFHYRPRLIKLLQSRNVDCSLVRDWLETCAELHELCVAHASDFVRWLDAHFPGYNFTGRFHDPRSRDANVLRILRYAERGPGDSLTVGKYHVDRNFFTFALGESHPGLRIFPEGESGAPIAYRATPDNVLAFPGAKFAILTAGRIAGLGHDVVNENPAAPPRWSVVFFAHVTLE